MLAAKEALDALRPLGFERVEGLNGTSYRDCSTIVVCPTRGQIHPRVVQSWLTLIPPMNQPRAFLMLEGEEVGQAYDRFVKLALEDERLKRFRYVLSVEDDNVLPPDAHVRLLEAIERGPFDGVGGLYFTKGEIQRPMAYGDPEEFFRTGRLDFRPRYVEECLRAGQIMEVNGIGMGCSLFRLDIFRQIEPPWFVTLSDVEGQMTQDLYFCRRARIAGKRFAVDCRVRVGHLDIETGVLY